MQTRTPDLSAFETGDRVQYIGYSRNLLHKKGIVTRATADGGYWVRFDSERAPRRIWGEALVHDWDRYLP